MSKTAAKNSFKKKIGRPRKLKTRGNTVTARLSDEENLDYTVTAYLMDTDKSKLVRDFIKGLIAQEKAGDAQKFAETKKQFIKIWKNQGRLSAPRQEEGKRRSPKLDLNPTEKEQAAFRLPAEDNLEFSVATSMLSQSKTELLTQAVKEIIAKVKDENSAKFTELTEKYRALHESCPKSRKSNGESNPEQAQQ